MFSWISGVLVLHPGRIPGLPSSVGVAPPGDWTAGYAGRLLWNAGREKIVDASLAVAPDMAWVAASYAWLFAVRFSSGGKWIVVWVAELVFLFEAWQWFGLRQVGRSRQAA